MNFYKERSKRSTYTSLMTFRSVARLLISIDTIKVSELRAGANMEKLSLFDTKSFDSPKATSKWNSSAAAMTTKEFVAFAIISEVNMIDSRFRKGPISFQLCVGNNGYDNMDSGYTVPLFGSRKTWPSNFSEPQTPVQFDAMSPIYLPYEKSKECLTLKFPIGDLRHFMLKSNYVQTVLRMIVRLYLDFFATSRDR